MIASLHFYSILHQSFHLQKYLSKELLIFQINRETIGPQAYNLCRKFFKPDSTKGYNFEGQFGLLLSSFAKHIESRNY